MQVKISAREGGRQRKVTHCCRRDAVKETLCRIFSGGNAERKGYIKQKICQEVFYGVSKVVEAGTDQKLFSGSQ